LESPHDERYSSQYLNLAEERLGSVVLETTDDFFAEKENLIKPGRGIFIPGKFTDDGKWMDGWESRRKRIPGHDWCNVRLGVPGKYEHSILTPIISPETFHRLPHWKPAKSPAIQTTLQNGPNCSLNLRS